MSACFQVSQIHRRRASESILRVAKQIHNFNKYEKCEKTYLFSLGNLTYYYGTMINHQDSYIPGLIKFYEKLYHHNMGNPGCWVFWHKILDHISLSTSFICQHVGQCGSSGNFIKREESYSFFCKHLNNDLMEFSINVNVLYTKIVSRQDSTCWCS